MQAYSEAQVKVKIKTKVVFLLEFIDNLNCPIILFRKMIGNLSYLQLVMFADGFIVDI